MLGQGIITPPRQMKFIKKPVQQQDAFFIQKDAFGAMHGSPNQFQDRFLIFPSVQGPGLQQKTIANMDARSLCILLYRSVSVVHR